MSTEFEEGRFTWASGTLLPVDVRTRFLGEVWDGGFLAFSKKERLINTREDIGIFLAGRTGEKGSAEEGYLMEAGLWRCCGALREELSLERDGDCYFFQHWALESRPESAGALCWYRRARTYARPNLRAVFPDTISTIEIIVPEHRLRVYLTVQGLEG